MTATIVAISTPAGTGGIAVVRLSGPDALAIADRVWKGRRLSVATSHTAHLGTVNDSQGQPLDQAVATVFKAPASFTGQDTVEFSVHGSPYIQREIIASLVSAGARTALPGEFTRRAFLSGKMELTQAEAVADMIASQSRAAHRLAMSQLKGTFQSALENLRLKLIDLVSLMELELDFSEEDVIFADRTVLRRQAEEIESYINRLLATYRTGDAIRRGVPIAIVGPTNAGKSSLLNALLDYDRAIVSDIHGTTRDTIEDIAEIGDYQFRFIDTAGLRATDDPIESLGIDRSLKAADKAHIIISVVDATDTGQGELEAEKIAGRLKEYQSHIVVYNKSDLAGEQIPCHLNISAKSGDGIEELKSELIKIMDAQRGLNGNTEGVVAAESGDNIIVSNERHARALIEASKSARAVIEGLDNGLPTDLVARDARSVLDALAEITGQISTNDILGTIFSRFCIGK